MIPRRRPAQQQFLERIRLLAEFFDDLSVFPWIADELLRIGMKLKPIVGFLALGNHMLQDKRQMHFAGIGRRGLRIAQPLRVHRPDGTDECFPVRLGEYILIRPIATELIAAVLFVEHACEFLCIMTDHADERQSLALFDSFAVDNEMVGGHFAGLPGLNVAVPVV